jgi:hypothetical protein
MKKACNVTDAQRPSFEMILSWFENWRVPRRLQPGREAARAFWEQQVKSKPRAPWEMEPRKEAFSGYLDSLKYAQAAGTEVRIPEERVFQAMDWAGQAVMSA